MHILLLKGGTPDHVGLIPNMLDQDDPRPVKEQLDAGYQHGGGWRPMSKFKQLKDGTAVYPGDPPMPPRAMIHVKDEIVIIYDYGFVAIVQKDGGFEIARMD